MQVRRMDIRMFYILYGWSINSKPAFYSSFWSTTPCSCCWRRVGVHLSLNLAENIKHNASLGIDGSPVFLSPVSSTLLRSFDASSPPPQVKALPFLLCRPDVRWSTGARRRPIVTRPGAGLDTQTNEFLICKLSPTVYR